MTDGTPVSLDIDGQVYEAIDGNFVVSGAPAAPSNITIDVKGDYTNETISVQNSYAGPRSSRSGVYNSETGLTSFLLNSGSYFGDRTPWTITTRAGDFTITFE